MKVKALFIIVSFFLLACSQSCSFQTNKHPSELDFSAFPLKTISEYGFFEGNIRDLKPVEGVLFYEPIAPLFSDYALKKRFVWMPQGSSATFDENKPDEALDFPDKTVLIKNFYYAADFSKPNANLRILETRLLVKDAGKWKAYPYQWNKDQTEANYKVTGGVVPVSWKDEQGETHQINYSMPNKNQCKSCHNRNDVFVPVGAKIKQLNHSVVYEDGKTENQLHRWQRMGYLKNIEKASKIMSLADYKDPKADLNHRARSYLDANCSYCHNPESPASTSGLYLNIEEERPFHFGIMKNPVAAGMGAGTFKFDVYPKQGDASIITYRMNSTHPAVMMPELGRTTVHKEGVALIRAWIDSL